MKPIVFSYQQSDISQAAASVMLRFAYVFSGFAISMGDLGEGMAFTGHVNKLSVKEQIAYMESISAARKDEETIALLKNSAWLYKSYNSLKYKTPQQISIFKKFEQKLYEMYMAEVTVITCYLQATGITELSKLIDGASFGFFGINPADAETKLNEYFFTASEILTNGFTAETPLEEVEDEDNSNVYFLPPHFFDEAFAKQYTLVSAYSSEAQDLCNVYAEEIFTLPDINSFTAEELKRTKTQLGVFAEPFKKESVRFFEKCYNDDSPAERIAAFTSHVLPAAATYKQHIQQNELLQLCRRVQLNHTPAAVTMGEIPVVLLWEFYRYMKLIKDATWCKLQPLMQHENFCNRRLPFLAIKKPSFLNEGTYAEQNVQQPLPAPGRKFISVD